uniref:Uncharacterized protein n=1 Tax=Knipowitschia caucasica TaxID=637954 RepID=A0AAV2K7Y7_KNICA
MKSSVKQLTNVHRSGFARINSVQSQTKEEEVPPAVKPGDLVYVKNPPTEVAYTTEGRSLRDRERDINGGAGEWIVHVVPPESLYEGLRSDSNGEKTIKENVHGCQGDKSLEGANEDFPGVGRET